MNQRFQIGDLAWRASFEASQAYVTCPDCGGQGRIRCIMHDDTVVSVECQACSRGYEGPKGCLTVYDRIGSARACTVTGVEIRDAETTWYAADGPSQYHVPDSDIFDNEEEAIARAGVMAAEADAADRARIAQREKQTKSWAWNASYHRKCIKDAEKNIEYHKSKLAVASLKAKQDKAGIK